MPQLDVVTFINQYVWVIGSVSSIIIISIITILPSIKKLNEIRHITGDEVVSFKKKREYSTFKKLLNY
ncbi:ATP synthase F0 subunit 8 (mitochondrion) [Rhopilema esculentum]|uniref:ATP synthase F0 subunit 8 n=1 Tax=Rhopilema esculentum TaxID=499914 RepID=A0A222YVG3_9CNID|nr:ATP synthase F0 subunit 8 [Rhopilema esculentum]ASR75168.1 ATP synthase F0 subunit 8 [Rhopilema esculentum]